jgi:hypothetical protein
MAKKPPRYEGSPKDVRQDSKGARRLGVSLKKYEGTSQDKREDAKGQASLRPSNMGRPNQRQTFGKGKR